MNTLDYKASFEQSSSLMVMIDTDFTIVAVSDLFLLGTHTIRAEILGRNIFDIFPDNPADVNANGESQVRASLNLVLKTKIAQNINVIKYDIPKPTSEGNGFIVKYWQTVNSPVLDEFNNVKYIVERIIDVTENITLIAQIAEDKKLLKKVTDSEKRYNLLLMKSPFAFAIFKGKEMIITLANDSIKKLWDKFGQIEGKPLFGILPELINTPFPQLLNDVYTTGIPYYGDEVLAQIQREGGLSDAYFNFVYQPYLEEDETISGVTVIAYEVTSQVLLKNVHAQQRTLAIKAMHAIEDSNNHYYTMLMHSSFAFAILKGKDLVVTLANNLIKEFWGKGNDIEGKPLLDILPEIKEQVFPEIMARVLATGIAINSNETLAKLTYQGKVVDRYFNIQYQPYLEADESISGVIIIAYEVTEMVLARMKIEESERRFQAAVDVIQGVIWTTNPLGEIIEEQQSWGNLAGQTYEAYKGFGWANAIHPEDVAKTLKIWGDALLSKQKYSCEHRLKLADGSWGVFSVKATPLFYPDGSIREWIGVYIDISLQRKAENAIKESEKKFKQLLDSVPQKINNTDDAGNAIFFNKQWLVETGLTDEALKGNGWKKIIHPSDLEITLRNWQKSFISGEIFNIECRILNKNGTYRWNISTGVPIKDESGALIMWVGCHTDIQEQKDQKSVLENAIRESTKELIEANEALVLQNEWKEKRTADLLILSDNLKNKQWQLSKANLLLTKQEETVKVINLELSKLNQELEERVERRTKALTESENRFRSMMESIPQIAWTSNNQLEVNFYNENWYNYTGLDFEQTKLLGWDKVVHPEDLENTFIRLNAILKNIEGGEFQTRLKSANNKYRWYLARLAPIRNEIGEAQLWVGTATDIHELKLLQEQKDDFISIASHELKTPITSLKLSLQLLNQLKETLNHHEVPNLISQANRSLDKFTIMIDHLLNASRVNTGKLYLNKTQFIISKLINDCCSYVRSLGLYTLTTQGDLELEVFADPERIEQVIINFVNNAIKYAPNSMEIIINIEHEVGQVKVSVIDKGPGISKKNIENLFDRYYRVDNNLNYYPGLGLGLYIASEIIRKHEGRIGVESKLDHGSAFWFTLPL